MWQFAEAVAGLGDACRALAIPITGGNVSLYNETDGRAILPTPIIGVVGLIDDASRAVTRVFPDAGLDIVLLGTSHGELGGSEYLYTVHGLTRGVPPALDLAAERALQALVADLIARGLARSAQDCSEGGVAVALAECCFDSAGVGASVAIPGTASDGGVDRLAAALFGESASRVLVSVAPGDTASVLAAARSAGVPAAAIGKTGGAAIRVAVDDTRVIDCSVLEAEARWRAALPNWLESRVAQAS
jgi:phosphoribosylformylglycinamidine synthase